MNSPLRTFTKAVLRFSQTKKPLIQTCARFKTYSPKDILSTREINIYKKLFDKMDSNKDGYLTREDLKKGLKDFVNYTASEEELNETMETLDNDKDGTVGFEEFIGYIAWSRQMRTEEAITYAFETFDRNNDGLINKDELREALVSLGVIPNESLLTNIMLLSDSDTDGNITLEEFKKVFYSKDLVD